MWAVIIIVVLIITGLVAGGEIIWEKIWEKIFESKNKKTRWIRAIIVGTGFFITFLIMGVGTVISFVLSLEWWKIALAGSLTIALAVGGTMNVIDIIKCKDSTPINKD